MSLQGDYGEISEHFLEKAGMSDYVHVMWLNRYITKESIGKKELEDEIEKFFDTSNIKDWVISKAVSVFYGETPNLYIVEMQRPSKWLLLGYAFEHHHFLKQWVRSCSLIISNTDKEEVQQYEIDNILSEWHGTERMPSHHELLLRMAESYGVSRETIYKTNPLNATTSGIDFWDMACRQFSFVEGMSAMHTLELIPSRRIREFGGKLGYFDPQILTDGSITEEAVSFLREGYNADVGHSERALDLINKFSEELDLVQACQALVLKSLDKFSDYLIARYQRGTMLENQ